MNIKKINSVISIKDVVCLVNDPEHLTQDFLARQELDYIRERYENQKHNQFLFNRLTHLVIVKIVKPEAESYKTREAFRKAGDEIQMELNKLKLSICTVFATGVEKPGLIAFVEGCFLGNYQFIKYISDKEKRANTLSEINIFNDDISETDLNLLRIRLEAVTRTRDLVNEPVMHLNAVQLARAFEQMAEEVGVKVEVFNKKKIESLKMGGLLAVNSGSVDPPTFTVMEYKPENHKNMKPIVLIGKGVVYDTGGMNLKPGSFMNDMKLDMAGAATMASVICAAAKAGLPLHLVALMPATDNRVNGNAFVSGDVITMHNGATVEVLNTDAEGRLILADALSYAQKFNPALVITAATLTGSAMRAIGKYGVVAMHSKAEAEMNALKISGNEVYERVAEFPFWDEYADLLKSDIADMKNIGPPEAGMITAGKFLEKFTDYPFIHLDIAGVAFAEKRDSYKPAGGTGFGVRLLLDFLQSSVSAD